MLALFEAVGGRKMLLILVSVIVVLTQKWTGVSEEQINKLVLLVLGGGGLLEVGDVVSNLTKKTPTPPTSPPAP